MTARKEEEGVRRFVTTGRGIRPGALVHDGGVSEILKFCLAVLS